MVAKIISIVNQKGGVGKTTTAVNLSTSLSAMNKKTLIIDLDPQGNSSTGFGINQQSRIITIYQVLAGLNNLTESIMKTNLPNLNIITANTNLSAAELDLVQVKEESIFYVIY